MKVTHKYEVTLLVEVHAEKPDGFKEALTALEQELALGTPTHEACSLKNGCFGFKPIGVLRMKNASVRKSKVKR